MGHPLIIEDIKIMSYVTHVQEPPGIHIENNF